MGRYRGDRGDTEGAPLCGVHPLAQILFRTFPRRLWRDGGMARDRDDARRLVCADYESGECGSAMRGAGLSHEGAAFAPDRVSDVEQLRVRRHQHLFDLQARMNGGPRRSLTDGYERGPC